MENTKRKDSKGRILRDGERQRANGTYEYRYVDKCGIRHSVYSQRLVETDKAAGDATAPSLRELEKNINKGLEEGIKIYDAAHVTMNQLFDKFVESKCGIKDSTLETYTRVYNKHIRDYIGSLRLSQVLPSTISSFYKQTEKRLHSNTMIYHVDTVVKGMLDIAMKDRLIEYNPAFGLRKELKADKPVKMTYALTLEQQRTFLEYLCSSENRYSQYKNLFMVLSFTGFRISEVSGLQWNNVDFDNHEIKVQDTVRLSNIDHKTVWRRNTPKSNTGYRKVPMVDVVEKALKDQRQWLKDNNIQQPNIEGLNNFVFLTPRGNPIETPLISFALNVLVQDCNEIEMQRAKEENRAPIIVPHISSHVFRRTFCTRFCDNESNLKVVQTIMGHSSIQTTMIYNDVSQKVISQSTIAMKKIADTVKLQ